MITEKIHKQSNNSWKAHFIYLHEVGIIMYNC